MFNVTDSAKVEVAAYFSDKEVKPIRLFVQSGGCSGSSLVMAVDEKKDGDKIFSIDGIDYLIEEALFSEVQPIEIDFKETGFTINSSFVPEGGGCCGCSGGCGA